MRSTVILSSAFILALVLESMGCTANQTPSANNDRVEPPSTQSPTGPKPNDNSLRQRLDEINLWPEVDTSVLLPLLTSKTKFRQAGTPTASLQGPKEILKAMKALQTEDNPWRIAASRGYQTPSRIAVEFEFLRCSDRTNRVCEDARSGLLFAHVDGNAIEDVTLYLNDTWRPNRRAQEGKRPVRWVGGRRNPSLEKAFEKIWTGDLRALLSESFVYLDKATRLEVRGVEAFIAHRARYANVLPDGQCRSQEMHSAGDIVLALSVCEGTFTRDVRGAGRKVSVYIADVARFEGPLLVELHSYSNHESVKAQLGIPSPSPSR